jgi:hypothetical protein
VGGGEGHDDCGDGRREQRDADGVADPAAREGE